MTSRNPKFSHYDIHAIRTQPDGVQRVFVSQAIKAETNANKETWRSCLWCWKVSGRYQEGGVLGLAADLGRSTDTVYDRAHAYAMFTEMCNFEDGEYRKLAFLARRSPHITWSHFRALWDAKKSYDLTTMHVIEALIDIVSAEGDITSRGVDAHIRSHYGVEHGWEYYAQRANNAIEKALSSPAVPRRIRRTMKKLSKQLAKK